MGELPRQGRRWRSQFVLGCIGLVLLATGVLLAAVMARKELAPPLQLSVLHEPAGRSVANVQWGSTGPIRAQLEVVVAGKVLWSVPLSRNAAAQDVTLPRSLLGPKSRVIVASKGRTLRRVDG